MTSTDRELVAWRMVPVEPTDEMIRMASVCLLGCGWEVDGGEVDFRYAYAAMIAAAPPPTAPTVEEVARVILSGIPVRTDLANNGTVEATAARIIELFQGKA